MAQRTKSLPSQAANLTLRLLRKDDWPTIVELFGDNGACGGCWCMWWRVPKGGKLWEAAKGAKNRASFRNLIASGKVHGVLAFSGNKPVGWCCFGPRKSFPRLETVRALRKNWGKRTWSIVCFYILSDWRRKGVARRLLKLATEEAFRAGAEEVEGYPVMSQNREVPAPFAWTGVPSIFHWAQYAEIRNEEGKRSTFIRLAHHKSRPKG